MIVKVTTPAFLQRVSNSLGEPMPPEQSKGSPDACPGEATSCRADSNHCSVVKAALQVLECAECIASVHSQLVLQPEHPSPSAKRTEPRGRCNPPQVAKVCQNCCAAQCQRCGPGSAAVTGDVSIHRGLWLRERVPVQAILSVHWSSSAEHSDAGDHSRPSGIGLPSTKDIIASEPTGARNFRARSSGRRTTASPGDSSMPILQGSGGATSDSEVAKHSRENHKPPSSNSCVAPVLQYKG